MPANPMVETPLSDFLDSFGREILRSWARGRPLSPRFHRFGLGCQRGRALRAYRGPFPSGRVPCPPLLYPTLSKKTRGANFAQTAFYEVRLKGVLRSSGAASGIAPLICLIPCASPDPSGGPRPSGPGAQLRRGRG